MQSLEELQNDQGPVVAMLLHRRADADTICPGTPPHVAKHLLAHQMD